MPLVLVALFIGIPILEVTVIGRVEDLLGWEYTILILVADSLLGAVLVRQEGMRAWRRFVTALNEGAAPAVEVIDGALILFGGALLLTPGFVTDVVGLLCVLGPTRTALNRLLRRKFSVAAGPLGSLFLLGGSDEGGGGSPWWRRSRSEDPDTPPRAADTKRPKRDGPPPPGVIDVEVLDVRRNPRRRDDDE